MGEDSKKRDPPPQLLNLILDNREWKARETGGLGWPRSTSFGGEEDRKLELRLGLPGVIEEEIPAASREKKTQQEVPVLSLGYFPKHSKSTAIATNTTGAKRGFLDTVQPRTEGYNEQKQQARAGCGKESSLGEEKKAAESERKKGCCPPPSAAAPVHSSSSRPQTQGRGAAVPVVGWPPIRSFRRNLANSSTSKQSPESQNGEADAKAKLACKKSPLVKINMDGIPIGRKVDLAAYDSYKNLSVAVKELFHGFLEAQLDLSSAESAQGAEEKIFSRLLDGTGEYTLVYEDNEGDRMLVGDVPWTVFISTAKRLRVQRSSELSQGLIGAAPRRVANC